MWSCLRFFPWGLEVPVLSRLFWSCPARRRSKSPAGRHYSSPYGLSEYRNIRILHYCFLSHTCKKKNTLHIQKNLHCPQKLALTVKCVHVLVCKACVHMFNSVFGDRDIWNVKPRGKRERDYCKKEERQQY